MVDDPTQAPVEPVADALSVGNVPMDETGLPAGGAETPQETHELPQEYKSYSDINWELIPEEVREDVLAGVKKMHGGLTRDHQELADLRKRLPDVEKKSQALDWLWQQPWFRKAYGDSQNPSPQPETPDGPQLGEHLGDDASKAVQSEITRAVQAALGPLTEQLGGVQQRLVAIDTEREMNALAMEAEQKGWPNPKARISEIEAALRNGAPNIRAAYKNAVFDELPETISQKVQREYEQKLRKKADVTMPPGGTPSGTHMSETFKGPNCVQDAVRATLRTMNAQR